MVSNLYQSSWTSLDWILPFSFELGPSLKSFLVQQRHKGAWYSKDGSSTLQLKGSAPRDLKIFIKCYITTWVAVNPTTFLWLVWFPTWGVSSLVSDFLCGHVLLGLPFCLSSWWPKAPSRVLAHALHSRNMSRIINCKGICTNGSHTPRCVFTCTPMTWFNAESASTGFQGHLRSRTHGL